MNSIMWFGVAIACAYIARWLGNEGWTRLAFLVWVEFIVLAAVGVYELP